MPATTSSVECCSNGELADDDDVCLGADRLAGGVPRFTAQQLCICELLFTPARTVCQCCSASSSCRYWLHR
jgi:hypothetical protein